VRRVVAAFVILAGVASPSLAQWDDRQICRREGREYREGARVCSNDLVLLCINGDWQNLDGERCSRPGAYLNPDQYYIVQDPILEIPVTRPRGAPR